MATDDTALPIDPSERHPAAVNHSPDETCAVCRTRALWIVTIASLLAAVSAAGFATYVWFELDDLNASTRGELLYLSSQITDVENDVNDVSGFGGLEDRVDDLEDSVGVVPGFDSLADQMRSLDTDLMNVEQDISNVTRDIDDLSWVTRMHTSAISDLQGCLNDYMETVAQSGGGRYTYYYC